MSQSGELPQEGASAPGVPDASNGELPPSYPEGRAGRLRRVAPLLAPVVVAPLLGGTAGRPYTLLVAVACGVLAIWGALRRPARGAAPLPLRVSWLGLALALAAGLTLLQVVPLPPGLRALLAPGSDPGLRLLLDEPGRWFPLSVDPAASLGEAARLLGYLCLLLALGQRLRRRGDGRLLGGAVVVGAGLVAACGGLSALGLHLPAPVGIPAGARTRALLPAALHNPNHMAALLTLGGVMTVAFVIRARAGRRLGLLGLLLLLDVALLGTLSRGGVVIGLLGQLAAALWLLRTGQTGRTDGKRLLFGMLVAVGLAGLLLPAALPSLLGRFTGLPQGELLTPGSKVQAWREALPLLGGHWPLGVGRGAFELVFQGAHTLSSTTRFVYLENEWLQVFFDWGVPAGIGLLALGLLGARDVLRSLREPRPGSSLRRAAVVALGALALHDVVDFSLEVGGVATAAICLVALCERPRLTLSWRWLLGLGAAAVGLALFAAIRCPSHDEDGARLAGLAVREEVPTEAVLRAGREATRRHPLDSYLYATVAARLQRDRDPAAAAWVNRALLANPRDVGARQVGSLLLAEHGHRQQALELLRQAIADGDFGQRRWLYQTAARLVREPSELPRVLPAALPGDPSGLPSAAFVGELLDELGSMQPIPWPLIRAVAGSAEAPGASASLKATAAIWSARAVLAQRDAQAAVAAAARMGVGADPLLWAGLLDLVIDAGDDRMRAAATELATAALAGGERAEPRRALGRLCLRRGQLDEARLHLDRALPLATDGQTAALLHDVRAEIEERAGNSHRAEHERALAAQRRRGP